VVYLRIVSTDKVTPKVNRVLRTSPAVSVLVKQGRLEVLHRFPVHRKVGKTALLLRGGSSMPLIEVPVLSTSPKLAKSPV
jgi:hypothetical protein